MKRILAIAFALAIAVGTFAGCGKSGGSASTPGGTASTVVSDDIFSKEKVTFLNDDGSSVYRIVRPDGDADALATSQYLFKKIKNSIGVSIKNVADTEDGTDVYEILVGNTNRTETQQAKEYLEAKVGGRYNDYIICTIGKKIVIYSDSADGLNAASEYFIANFCKPEGVEGGILFTKAAEGSFESITVNGIEVGRYDFVRPHYNSSYLTEVEMEKVVETVYNQTGYMMEIKHDTYTEPSDYEIIVGNTAREGVEKITNYDEYSIKVSGTKVYLNGGSPHATAIAVTEFAKLLSKGSVTDSDSTNGSYAQTVATYDASNYYIHKWGDDFDGDSVDTTKWDLITEEHYGKGADGMSGQNGKQALRVPEANVVKNGYLYQLQYYDDKAYYGGTIRTNNHMKYMGGYLEHSVITPDNPSSWNTLWLAGVESNGVIGPEVDLNENFGNPNITNFNAHVWPKSNSTYGWTHRSFDGLKPNEKKYMLPEKDRNTENLNTGFHTFGFLWREDYIAFIGDGEIYVDMNLNQEGFEDFKMAFTTVACKVIIAASPGVGSGPKDTSTEEHWTHEKSDYVTDYVHIYQLDDGWSRMEFDY